MALPPGILTLQAHNTQNLTCVNNVWCTEEIMGLVMKCDTEVRGRPLCTDHFPITTVIDM
ncbi:hypothetical protein BDN71DRAFT_1360414, partial [Pleurotus eryngii]